MLGFAANVPVSGRYLLTASKQMHNRSNGKGGGIAMVGLDPSQVGVDESGKLQDLETPYPGGNLSSLASGGAIYIRDPIEG